MCTTIQDYWTTMCKNARVFEWHAVCYVDGWRLTNMDANMDARLSRILSTVLDCLDMSDPDNEAFRDSGADVVEHLWTIEGDMRQLARELGWTDVVKEETGS